ncbi:6-phosphogluconolactonase [Thalassococcus sp. S3]|uniref:6-phosphogluconolactonase n=1 Tax=Thalassococcus sp. S3 TaxID=2017482 RepID=UPI001023FF72|nr:6-phosphogluconolactonase [Thalassococcus sp. S3]QBF31782.1 6-phosphogluconolactonase [Thalassococcus sp. S3]
MNLVEYADREMLAIDVANMLASELKSCLLHHDHASFAVPGGTTPGPIFDALCGADLEWDRVHVMPTDERWVPETDERSNARLIKQRLLVDHARAARFCPLYADGDVDAVLPELASALEAEMPLSVLLLGMGSDMHTASLFPGADGLERALAPDAPILLAQRADQVPELRVTLSASVLEGAMSKHLVIFDDDKRAALERAMTLPPETAPINAVLTGMTIHWAE